MKRASAYQRNGQFIVAAEDETEHGVWIVAEGPIVLPRDSGEADLAAAVVQQLKSSRECVPHPIDWGAVRNRLLNAAGAKTWRSFSKGCRHVNVSTEDFLKFMICPSKNLGAVEGFEPTRSLPVSGISELAKELGEWAARVT